MRNRVRDLRRKKGWSQHDLASAAETSQQQIQRIEAGDQGVKLDLALRLSNALGADLDELFPGAKGVSRKKKPSRRDLEKLATNAKKQAAITAAGLDTDSDSWFLVVGLRNDVDLHLPIASEDKDRLRNNLSSLEDSATFFVFDSGPFHIALNLAQVRFIRELWEPDPTVSEWAAPKCDKEEITVYVSDRSGPLLFSGDPEWARDDGDIGQFQYLLDMAQALEHEHEFFEFLDGDGEMVFLRAHDVAFIAIPMWLTDAEFVPEEDGTELGTGEPAPSSNAPLDK